MKNIIITILILTLFIRCKDDYIIDIDIQNISDKKVQTIITTNFPENTVFSISAERLYKRKNDTNYYGGTLYYSMESAVKNGMIELSIDIDDKEWIDDYNDDIKFQKQLKIYNKKFAEIDYRSIKDSIEISVRYTAIFEQDKNIKKILGEKGENLRGKGTINVEDYQIFRKAVTIYSKFEQ
jgi:hypothetical protein